MQAWLRRFIRSFESSTVPMPYFVACFVLWISLRTVIESFVFRTPIPALIYLHFSLSYLSIALWLAVALGWACKRNMIGTLRPLLAGFIFVMLAPTLDALVFDPTKHSIGYHYVREWSAVLHDYLTFFGPLHPQGASPGMRTELALVLLVCFGYAYLVSQSVLRALLAVVASWTVFYAHIALKSIFELSAASFHFDATEGFDLYLGAFVLLSLIASLIILTQGARREVMLIAKDARWLRALHYGLLVLLGLALAPPADPFGLERAIHALLTFSAFFLAWVASVMTNNVFDIEIDRINAPDRPLVTGELPVGPYTTWAFWIFAHALLIGLTVSFATLLFVAIFGLAYFVYSAPPLRLKTRCFVSKAIIGINSTAALLAGYSLWGGDSFTIPKAPLLIVLIGFSLGAHVIDLKDVEGDRQAGIRNLSTMLGRRRAQWLIASLSLLAHGGLAYGLRETWLAGVFALAGIVQFFAITRVQYRDEVVLSIQNAVLASAVIYCFGS